MDIYVGINSVIFNLVLFGWMFYNWDVNLGEVSFFLVNNYVYLENISIFVLLCLCDVDVEVYFCLDFFNDLFIG